MSIVRGKDVVLLEYNSTLLAWIPFACARSCTLNVATDFIEVSITGSGKFRDFEPSANSFEGSLEGIMNLRKANHYTIADVRAKQIAWERVLMRYDRTDTNGHTYTDEAYFYFSNTTDTSSFDNIATFTMAIKGTGPLTQVFTPSPLINAIVYSLYYHTDGSGETSFQNNVLIGAEVVGAWRGQDYEVITAGTILANEIKHNDISGVMSWTLPMFTDEVWHILYKVIYEESS